MEILTLGEKTEGERLYLPLDYVKKLSSVPGCTYEILIATDKSISDKNRVAKVLTSELPKTFKGLKINWLEIKDHSMKIQVQGSPFAWATLLMFLPQILSIVGLIMVGVGVFLVYSFVPGWVTALIVVGLILGAIGLTPIVIIPMLSPSREGE